MRLCWLDPLFLIQMKSVACWTSDRRAWFAHSSTPGKKLGNLCGRAGTRPQAYADTAPGAQVCSATTRMNTMRRPMSRW